MSAAVTGGGSASCPTNLTAFAEHNPRAPRGCFRKGWQTLFGGGNEFTSATRLEELGMPAVFARYDHLYETFVTHATKHSTSSVVLTAFEAIENARSSAIQTIINVRSGAERPNIAGIFDKAERAIKRIPDGTFKRKEELLLFLDYLKTKYYEAVVPEDSESTMTTELAEYLSEAALEMNRRFDSLGSFGRKRYSDTELLAELNALTASKNTRRRKNRRRVTRRLRRRT